MKKVVILQMIDDTFWELVCAGKTIEEAFDVLGLGMPKGDEGKPFEAATVRWEYMVIDVGSRTLLEYLDELGPLGWELVLQNDEGLYVFKRRIQ